MKKLLQVVRGRPDRGLEIFLPDAGVRHHPQVVLCRALDEGSSNFVKEGEFFFIEDSDVDEAMRGFAQQNPGCEVRVYSLEQSGQCPAGPMVVKKITSDGVLPG